MKKTKESIIQFISIEEAIEFKTIATGRKFCKKGERIQDICMQEIKNNEYENSHNIFIKIFKGKKTKKNAEKLLLEKRTSNIIRTIAKQSINNEKEIQLNELVKKVKEIILESVENYLN